ncbi:MAG TPA: histidinol dehydrogenase, partial [Dehalococcoidales bacterium]
MKIIAGFERARPLLSRQAPTKEAAGFDEREPQVKQIIEEVRRRGDTALFEYTAKFDRARLTSLEVSRAQVKRAYREVDARLV